MAGRQELAALSALLSDDERKRASGFQFRPHARRYIVTRGRLRELLAKYLGVRTGGIRLHAGAHGKPYMVSPRADLHFNVSHAHELAAIGIRWGAPLGVDVERIRPSLDVYKMAPLCFSPAELREFSRLPAGDVLETFFVGWTRKEAYTKAIGLGAAIAAGQFDVSLSDWRHKNPSVVRRRKTSYPWQVCTWMPERDYMASLCCGCDVRRVVHMRMSQPEVCLALPSGR